MPAHARVEARIAAHPGMRGRRLCDCLCPIAVALIGSEGIDSVARVRRCRYVAAGGGNADFRIAGWGGSLATAEVSGVVQLGSEFATAPAGAPAGFLMSGCFRLPGWGDSVSEPRDGLDGLGFSEFVAESGDRDADGFGEWVGVFVPDLFEQFLCAECAGAGF